MNLANPQWRPNYIFSTMLVAEGSNKTQTNMEKRNHFCTFLGKVKYVFHLCILFRNVISKNGTKTRECSNGEISAKKKYRPVIVN